MADDPKRQQIMEAIDARFKTILVSGGYKTNLGRNIYPWKTTDFNEHQLPGMSHRDLENAQSSYSCGEYINKLTVELEIHPAPGRAAITDAYALIEDVFKAIAVDDRWEGLAEDTQPAGDKIEIEQHDRIVGRITLTIRIEYTSNKWSF